MEEFDDYYDNDYEEMELIVRLPKRYFRDFENPLEFYREDEFRRRFRFSKDCVVHIILPLVVERLEKVNNRGLPILPVLQLLIALRFYATNSFQIVHGDLGYLSQSSTSRIMKRISICLAEQLDQHVYFPRNDEHFRANTASFYTVAQFPNVSGCIDGTHIRIINPGGQDGEVFRNRKGWFSLNVQAVVGPKSEILDIVVRHPGSTHDNVIFDRSALRARFQLNQIPGLLFGDNGYACKNYLLTPILNPNTNSERRYNEAHRRTRNAVERLFGKWKRIFPCLHSGLRTKLRTSTAIICATAILYNIRIRYNQDFEFDNDDDINDCEVPIDNIQFNDAVGLAFRTAFIEAHFR